MARRDGYADEPRGENESQMLTLLFDGNGTEQTQKQRNQFQAGWLENTVPVTAFDIVQIFAVNLSTYAQI